MSEREKFEKWWSSLPLSYRMTFQTNEYHWAGFQAALSTRKPYGYGIVDKDGKFCGAWKMEASARQECYYRNEEAEKVPPGYPFRVVELFYEDSES